MARNDIATTVPVATRRSLPSFTDHLIEPLSRLRGEVDRLFEDFPSRWPTFQFSQLNPRIPVPAVEMTETDKAYKLSVEVPGIEAKDVRVDVEGDVLVISGEKKEQREEKEKDYFLSERSYGSFERRIALPTGADAEKIKAKAKNGVLQITLPKNPKAVENSRRIEIEAA